MFILRFINDDDDLSVKEFVSLADLKEYINQKNLLLNPLSSALSSQKYHYYKTIWMK